MPINIFFVTLGKLELSNVNYGSDEVSRNVRFWTNFVVKFCRLRELHTLKGHVESVVKLKGLDIDPIQQHYTV